MCKLVLQIKVDMNNFNLLKKQANGLRKGIVDLYDHNHKIYLGESFAIIDLFVLLYNSKIYGDWMVRGDVFEGADIARDLCLLSNPAYSLAYYMVLNDQGVLLEEDFKGIQTLEEIMEGKLNYHLPGVEFSLDLPGSCVSVGAGIAKAYKNDKKEEKVFIVVSESELQSGRVWESIQFIVHNNLDNIVLIVSCNNYQNSGAIRKVLNVGSVFDKLELFGMKTIRVVDGNNMEEMFEAFKKVFRVKRSPVALVLNTTLGSGVKFLEKNNLYNYTILSDQEKKEAIDCLNGENDE